MADDRPIGAIGAFRNVMQWACITHFLEHGMPGVFEVNIASAHIPFMRVAVTLFGMLREVILERFIGCWGRPALRTLGGKGCHSILSRGRDSQGHEFSLAEQCPSN